MRRHTERRRLARQAVQDAEKKPCQPPVPELDDESVALLRSLLALPSRTAQGATGDEGAQANRLRAPVAGYAHAFDPAREAGFAAGQALALIREPENSHDRNAIRIEWRGEKIGYVPRPENAAIAGKIDSGTTLTARIGEFVPQAPPWQRLWFEIVGEGGG